MKRRAVVLGVLGVVAAAALALGACRSHRADSARAPGAERVVTVGGAVTEIAFALGVGSRIVGVDSSSVHPADATRLPQVGYQRALSAEPVLALQPTLVLASADAGPPVALEQLRAAGVRVVIIPAEHSIDGAAAKVQAVALALHREAQGEALVRQLRAEVAATPPAGDAARPRVLFIYARGGGSVTIAGRGTAADAMIALAGGTNVLAEVDGYRPLTAESVVAAAPDVVLFTTRGLEGAGGVDGALGLPGLALTPAGRARRVVAMDDLYLLGFGPRTGRAVQDLARTIRQPAAALRAGAP